MIRVESSERVPAGSVRIAGPLFFSLWLQAGQNACEQQSTCRASAVYPSAVVAVREEAQAVGTPHWPCPRLLKLMQRSGRRSRRKSATAGRTRNDSASEHLLQGTSKAARAPDPATPIWAKSSHVSAGDQGSGFGEGVKVPRQAFCQGFTMRVRESSDIRPKP